MKPSLLKSLKRAAYRLRRKRREQGGLDKPPPSDLDAVIDRFVDKMRKKPANGPDWNMNPDVERFVRTLKGELQGWVDAEIEMPILRHKDTERLMHAVGRPTLAKVLLSMTLSMDYVTCNVGTPQLDQTGNHRHWTGRSIPFHADVAGVSYSACKDALEGLHERGCMSRFTQAETDANDEVHGRASLRHIVPDFFRGMTNKVWMAFKEAQQKIWKATNEAKEKVVETAEAMQRLAVNAAEAARKKADKAARKVKAAVGNRSPEIEEAILAIIRKANPSYLRPKAAPS